MLPWLIVLAVALAATDAREDSLDKTSYRRGPDIVCRNEVNDDLIKVNCTLPSGNLFLEVNRFDRDLYIFCFKNSTLVCDELEEVKPFFDEYKVTGSMDESFHTLHIETCNLSRESLACLLGMVGANGTDLVKQQGVAGTLEPVRLEGLEGITKLIMYDVDKSVASVPYNVLSLLPNLKVFSMQKAFLKLTSESDYVLSKLRTLELYQCRIKSVPKGAFKTTPEIQELTLSYNIIEFIDVDAFEGLTKLKNLFLSANHLTRLPGGTFRHTPNILYLFLNANKLIDLSDDLFTGLNKLKRILISDNEAVLKLSNQTFSNLPSLHDLYLDRCFIENISAELFRNTTNLKKISIKGNNIKYIPNKTFKGLKLTNLDLSHNKISYLNSDVFSEQTSMTELNLSYNDLKSLPGELFSNMNSLTRLDLGHNSIGFLNKSTFDGLNNLKKLLLTENRIKHLDEESFAPTVSLQVLSLSKNNLTISIEKNVRKVSSPFVFYLSPLANLTGLRILDLSHNNISVYCKDWTFISLSKLDLSHNYITSLPPEVSYENDAEVDLRHNNIKRFELPINKQYTTKATFLMDYNPYSCDYNLYYFIHNYKLGTKMFEIDIEQAECAQPPALKGVKLLNLQLEDLTCDVDCKTGDIIKHPSNNSNCKCIKNPIQKRLEMFCDYFPDVYPELPKKIKYTYLKLRYVTDVPLLPAEVEIVDFSSLNLTEPPIANSIVLNLTNNHLTKAPLELFQRNCSVYLSNNPFDCTCGGMDNVLALNAFKNRIPDYKNLTCSNGIFVSNTVVEQLCAVRNGIIIGLSLGIIAILFIICTIIAIKYTTELRIILRGLGLWRGDVLGGEIYDAFVSFAHQDEDFVREKLLPKLEKGKPPLKICIHSRDWVIGDYIPAQISRSVDQSRYTIIVLSRNFVESMWGRMEFRTAHAKDRAIILMLDDLSADKSLDPELRAYISMKTNNMGKPRKKLTREEKLANDRLRKREKYAQIKENPELYSVQKEKERRRYLARKEKNKICGIKDNMTPRSQREQRRRWQKNSLQQNLNEKEILVHIDFSENYCLKYNQEIQSFHFGGSREQVSLHTGVVYYKDSDGETFKTKSFCTVSNCL